VKDLPLVGIINIIEISSLLKADMVCTSIMSRDSNIYIELGPVCLASQADSAVLAGWSGPIP